MIVPAAIVSGFGLCAKVLVAARDLFLGGDAAEVASDSDDSAVPIEHRMYVS
jgi:large subunit ribosomal protein L19